MGSVPEIKIDWISCLVQDVINLVIFLVTFGMLKVYGTKDFYQLNIPIM